mgnify:CR=1 FL=1
MRPFGVEYAAFFLHYTRPVPFWDYKALPWNFQGRVCLIFSLIWGLMALPLVYWVEPWLSSRAALIPPAG